MMRATGLRRASDDPRRPSARLYLGAGAPRVSAITYPIQQPIRRIIDQGSLPACVGCAMCAGAEAALGIPPRLSWVRIWTDARFRDGSLRDDSAGTWFASAIESVVTRGLDPEEPGEWNRVEEMTEPDDLDSQMAAHDNRQTDAEHWRVGGGDLDAVDDALSRGLAVGIATGVKGPYFDYFSSPASPDQVDPVLGTAYLGGSSNGHEQRIVAVEKTSSGRVWTIQNSWGLSGGCHLPDGTFQLGCCRVSESVLIAAWDIDCIRITKR